VFTVQCVQCVRLTPSAHQQQQTKSYSSYTLLQSWSQWQHAQVSTGVYTAAHFNRDPRGRQWKRSKLRVASARWCRKGGRSAGATQSCRSALITAQHCVLFCQAAHLRRTGCPLPHCEAKGQSVHLPCMRGHSYYQLCGRQVSCAECTCTSFRCSPSRFLVAAMQQCQADRCDMFGLRAARRLWCWCHVRVSDRVQGRARRRRSVRHSSST